MEKLTEDIRLHHQEYTTADWKKAYARYEQIAAEMENYQYTKEEAEKIGKLEGECVGYFMKSAIKSLDGLESEIKGFFDGIEDVVKYKVKYEEKVIADCRHSDDMYDKLLTGLTQ